MVATKGLVYLRLSRYPGHWGMMRKQWIVWACLGGMMACSSQGEIGSDEGLSAHSADALLASGVSAEVLLDNPVSIPLFTYAPGPLSISADPNGFLVSWLDSRES